MNSLYEALAQLREKLNIPLLQLGVEPVTLWAVLQVAVLATLLVYFSGLLRWLVVRRLLGRSQMDQGVRLAIGAIVRYVILGLGMVVILQTAGIDLTALNVLAGAVGIGLGFGMQTIVGNFISGIIILFERPIKVGDRIVVGEVEGDVIHIGGRSTTVVTNDNISIIVPNSKFVTENVVNWSHNDRTVRFRIPVSVAYGSDLELVERLLHEAAAECPDVLSDPAPAARLMTFGDSGLGYELRVWSTTLIHRRGVLTSTLNRSIYGKFTTHGIEIPFPQRDLHLHGDALQSKEDA